MDSVRLVDDGGLRVPESRPPSGSGSRSEPGFVGREGSVEGIGPWGRQVVGQQDGQGSLSTTGPT